MQHCCENLSAIALSQGNALDLVEYLSWVNNCIPCECVWGSRERRFVSRPFSAVDCQRNHNRELMERTALLRALKVRDRADRVTPAPASFGTYLTRHAGKQTA